MQKEKCCTVFLAFIENLKYQIRLEKEGKTLIKKNYLLFKWKWQVQKPWD